MLVVAKQPVPGRVKTRLSPPLSLAQAAEVAEAALADTLEAVAGCGADRRVLALDGEPGDWIPAGFEVIAQRGQGLAERLAAAWADAGAPGLQIGMDTPQVTPDLLDAALSLLADGDEFRGGSQATGPGRAVLGPAADGGWWAIGLSRPAPEVFAGVPMSTPDTGAAQRRRLRDLGWSVDDLPVLRDLDTAEDLGPVAAAAGGRTASVVTGLTSLVAQGSGGRP